jgi:hypothetical protein
MVEPPVIGMMVPNEGNAFGLLPLELNSGLDELTGGGGNISFHWLWLLNGLNLLRLRIKLLRGLPR